MNRITDVLSEQQIIKVFEEIIGFPPRQADLALLSMLGNDVSTLAQYLWDHWMSEPDEPNQEEVENLIRALLS